MKKRIPLLAAFFVPLLIIIIICIDHEVFPFGEQCILHIDMYHQYCPFFTELADKLQNGGSAFYSWKIGLGADFVSLYAYYLASPLNWLLILCPTQYIIEFMTILVVLKVALCGLTFAYYLQKHFETNHFAIAIFGSAYALSAFMAAYAWNIMWTDCMVLAPLVILGVERLIKEGRALLYYCTLALCIVSNYYISIMICIFVVLWFLLCWWENRKTGIAPWLRFAGYSLLAGGTGAVLIIPTAIVLGYSGASGISFPDTVEWYFSIASELARHLLTVDVYTGADHWPNIYCGIFALVFLALYVLNTRIPWKSKIPRLAFLALFILSFSNNILDFIWHGLHFPTSLPGRQTFLYIFVLLVIAFEAFLRLRGNKLWHVAVAAALCAAFLVVTYHDTDAELIDAAVFYVSAIFMCFYLVLVAGYLMGNVKVRRLMLAVGCLAVTAELTINHDATGLDTVNRTSYVKNLSDYRTLLGEAGRDADEDGQMFFRTEELERRTKNDAALSGYRSATQFSSLMNLNVSHFYQDVGMEGGKNFYSYSGATPLLSAMLSIRYVLADNAYEASPIRSLVAQSGDTYLYENAYTLPMGFMMSEQVIDAWDYEDAGDIGAQNMLARLLGSTEEMLVPVASVSAEGEAAFDVPETGYYFATYEKTTVDNLTEETSDGRSRSFTKVSHGYTLDLGYCEAGTKVKVTNTANETVALTVYYLNMGAMQTAYGALCAQTMDMTSFSDTKITGTVEAEQAGRLIFSIAQEAGWTLYVDGVQTEAQEFAGAFLSVHLEPGIHDIMLRYRTPGFVPGACISLGCAALAALFLYLEHRRIRMRENKESVL